MSLFVYYSGSLHEQKDFLPENNTSCHDSMLCVQTSFTTGELKFCITIEKKIVSKIR